MEYDAKIIVEFASKLYTKADSIIATHTAIGVLIGLVVGGYMKGGIGAIVGGAIVGAIGYSIGSDKVFQIKLQAQVSLCQVQIEKNTRNTT